MGMYDNVNYKCVCPVCKNKITGFQTKSGECMLEMIEPADVNNFYALCDKCGCWIEFTKRDDGTYERITTPLREKADGPIDVKIIKIKGIFREE